MTSCGIVDEGTRVERFICSPWHEVANIGTMANGILLVVGALLLWNFWPKQKSGRAAMLFFATGGVLVVGVGAFPWDTHPDLHNLAALTQGFFQWVGMVLLLVSIHRVRRFRALWWLTLMFLVVSVTGFTLFVDAVGGGSSALLGLGLVERIAFDTLILWGVAAGWLMLRVILTGSGPSPSERRGSTDLASLRQTTRRSARVRR